VSSFDFGIPLPLMVGVVIGLVLFSRLLAWLFDNFKAATISVLTGFVAGSLLIIWPWKQTINTIVKGKEKAIGYEWFFPEMNTQFLFAVGLIVLGFLAVWVIDRKGGESTN